MKRHIPKLIVICILIFVVSCIMINRNYKTTDIYPEFSAEISQISIHYGNGISNTITDTETINKITNCVLELNLKRYYFYDLRNKPRSGVGYGIEFYNGSNISMSIAFKESKVLSINGKLYSIDNTDLHELISSTYQN